jgi:hypothetical protein
MDRLHACTAPVGGEAKLAGTNVEVAVIVGIVERHYSGQVGIGIAFGANLNNSPGCVSMGGERAISR